MDGELAPTERQIKTVLASEWAFLLFCALLFLLSVGGTLYWWRVMSAGASMDGDMSMVWEKMPYQSWLSAGITFVEMWVVMMVSMMLPALVPLLLRYRKGLRLAGVVHLWGMTTLAGVGYFFVWAIFGALAYPLGISLSAAVMQWNGLASWLPVALGVTLLLAGGFQLTRWKTSQLGYCWLVSTQAPGAASHARGALLYGLRLGVNCSLCCFGYMVILLVTGVMNLGVMVLIAVAILVERIVPKPRLVTLASGIVIVVIGVLLIVRTLSSLP